MKWFNGFKHLHCVYICSTPGKKKRSVRDRRRRKGSNKGRRRRDGGLRRRNGWGERKRRGDRQRRSDYGLSSRSTSFSITACVCIMCSGCMYINLTFTWSSHSPDADIYRAIVFSALEQGSQGTLVESAEIFILSTTLLCVMTLKLSTVHHCLPSASCTSSPHQLFSCVRFPDSR